jgi:hypothetical protein
LKTGNWKFEIIMNTNPTFERTTLVTMRAPMGCRRVGCGVAMVRLLVLSALCGWAWSAAKAEVPGHETMGQSDHETVRPWDGVVWGLLVSLSGCLIVWLVVASVRRQRAEDGAAELDPYAGDGREDPMRVMLRRHGIAVVTTVDLQLLRDLALSEQGLTAVDRFVRWRWKKVLFMTSLMEMVALAGKLSQTVRRGDKETIRQSDTETERKEDAARWTVGPLESLGEADCIDRDDRSDGFQVSKSHGLPVSKSPTEGRAAV